MAVDLSKRTWMSYAIAAAAVAGVVSLRWLLSAAVGELPLYLLSFPTVALVAMFLGARPGVLATVLMALAKCFLFIPPLFSLRGQKLGDSVALGLFVATGLTVSWMAQRLDAARRREAETAERERNKEELVRRAGEIERQRQLLAVTLASISDGVIVTDAEGRLTFLNPEAEQLTGWENADAAGRPAWEVFRLIDGQTGEAAECPASKVLGSGGLVDLPDNAILVAKDGRRIPVDASGAPIRQHDGTVQGAVLVFRDITEKRKGEAAVAAAKLSAEQAREVAEAASRAKDHFLAVLSHELRTPLTPVLAAAGMLKAAPNVDHETRLSLEMIHRNAELEARLIDDLLDLNRIARGKIELNKRPVPISEIILHALEVCQPDIAARQLRLTVDIGVDESCIIEADPARLQQVFWNLFKNSIKFTSPGGLLAVRCRPDDGHALAEVEDSGQGMEPDAMERIFRPFEQAEVSITRQFGGLGLGLAISKALVEMHGGTIEAHSEGKGKGSTFRVRLPLVKESRPRIPSPELKVQTAVVSEDSSTLGIRLPATGRALRILLTEDHADSANILRLLLTRRGYQVQIAGDVATALHLASGQRFDLLISDLGLPDRSGLDLMRELRARGQALPGIALSGYGQEEDVNRSREAGFSAHMTKPVDFEQFYRIIAHVLSEPVAV